MFDDNFQQGKWHNGKMLSGTFKTFFSIYMLSVICRVMCVCVRKVKCTLLYKFILVQCILYGYV